MANNQANAYPMLTNATAAGAGESMSVGSDIKSFQAIGSTASGTGAASVDIEVSNNDVNWIVMGTIALTLGTAETTDGFVGLSGWRYIRANVKSISGTGAKVSVIVGV